MILGLDFDNTLVRYDKLFYKLARERCNIDINIPPRKNSIRTHLRSIGKEEEFTLLQGEVYGNRIQEAEAAEGMLDALIRLNKSVEMTIINHKTRYPYKTK